MFGFFFFFNKGNVWIVYIYIYIYTHADKQIFNKKSSAEPNNVGLLPSETIKMVGFILNLSR